MKVSKVKLKALKLALVKAAQLSNEHSHAVQEAASAFEAVFHVDVPEESFSMSGANNEEMVGSLFNNFTNHNENIAGGSVEELVAEIVRLMGGTVQ